MSGPSLRSRREDQAGSLVAVMSTFHSIIGLSPYSQPCLNSLPNTLPPHPGIYPPGHIVWLCSPGHCMDVKGTRNGEVIILPASHPWALPIGLASVLWLLTVVTCLIPL